MIPTLPDPDYHAEFYADVPLKRLLAWMVDTLISILLAILILPFTAFTGIFFFPFLVVVVGFFYRVATIAGGSATLGMRLMAIELRNMRGERLSPGEALVHTILYSVFVSAILPQLASAALMLTTARAQGLHDFVLGTAAINRAARG